MRDVFVFGSKIFPQGPEHDFLTRLPLEITWKIFSLLDDASLAAATRVCGAWRRLALGERALARRVRGAARAATAVWAPQRGAGPARRRTTRAYRIFGDLSHVADCFGTIPVAHNKLLPSRKRQRDEIFVTQSPKRRRMF